MIRCDACGHFIAFDDIDAGRVGFSYTPDSEFTREKCEVLCPACFEKEKIASTLKPWKCELCGSTVGHEKTCPENATNIGLSFSNYRGGP